MKTLTSHIFAATALMITAVACSHTDNGTSIEIVRADRDIAAYASMPPSSRDSILKVDGPAIAAISRSYGYSSDNMDSIAMLLSESEAYLRFAPDVERRLQGLDRMAARIGSARHKAASLLPDMPFPDRVYGIIIPFFQSVINVDTVCLVGLNHYLGTDYEGYTSFPEFMRTPKMIERMPYDIVEMLLRTTYPYQPDDNSTVLSEMIYRGAVTAVALELIGDKNLAVAMGITQADLDKLQSSEKAIWQMMIERSLLFNRDDMVAQKLLEPSPMTTIVTPMTPGRAGLFIGHSIVESYLKRHPELTPVDLLKPDFYNAPSVLVESGYEP